MAEKKNSGKLRIPLKFDEAVSDFLQVKPPAKKETAKPTKKTPKHDR
jgi:hypothetical protein